VITRLSPSLFPSHDRDAPWEKEAFAFGKKAYENIFKKWRR